MQATILYPTEYVKTQLQLQSKSIVNIGATGTTPTMHHIPYKGPLDCVARTVRERGVLGLYQGLSTLVIGTFAKAAVRFYSFNLFASWLRNDAGQMTTTRTMLGSVFGCGKIKSFIKYFILRR